jgi:hypothetical protein
VKVFSICYLRSIYFLISFRGVVMCLALSGPQRQTMKDQSVKTLLVTKKCVLQSRGQRHQFLLQGPPKNKDGLVQVAVKAKVLCLDGTRKLLCQSTKVFNAWKKLQSSFQHGPSLSRRGSVNGLLAKKLTNNMQSLPVLPLVPSPATTAEPSSGICLYDLRDPLASSSLLCRFLER